MSVRGSDGNTLRASCASTFREEWDVLLRKRVKLPPKPHQTIGFAGTNLYCIVYLFYYFYCKVNMNTKSAYTLLCYESLFNTYCPGLSGKFNSAPTENLPFGQE